MRPRPGSPSRTRRGAAHRPAGKRADLVLIKGNPAAKISDLRQVVTVFKDGVGYDSAKLAAAVKGQIGIR